MSTAVATDKQPTITGPKTRPVTLVILYGAPHQAATQIQLYVTIEEATRLVNAKRNSICSRTEAGGIDLHGNPYNVEIGSAALALYIAEE